MRGTRFSYAYVASPLCAPSRAALAVGRMEFDTLPVQNNTRDVPAATMNTFYKLLRDKAGYHVMTAGKDDLTKASKLGTKTFFPGCPSCRRGDGRYLQEELGFSDSMRRSV